MRNPLSLLLLVAVALAAGCRSAAERGASSESAHVPDSAVADTAVTDAKITAQTGRGGGFVDWAPTLPSTNPEWRRAVAEVSRTAQPDTSRDATVFAWGSSPRVLVRTYLPKKYLGQSGVALFAVENPATVSPPYGFGDEENVLVRDLGDYDGDGVADVVICAWYEAQEEPVTPRVIGYRAGAWYKILHPIRIPPSCMAAG